MLLVASSNLCIFFWQMMFVMMHLMGWVGLIWCVENCVVVYSVCASTCAVVVSGIDFIRAGLGSSHGAGAIITRNRTQGIEAFR